MWEPIFFWVYIPQNPAGKFYVGETEDLDARFNFHNQTDNIDGHFTRKNGPWKTCQRPLGEVRSAVMQ